MLTVAAFLTCYKPVTDQLNVGPPKPVLLLFLIIAWKQKWTYPIKDFTLERGGKEASEQEK